MCHNLNAMTVMTPSARGAQSDAYYMLAILSLQWSLDRSWKPRFERREVLP